MGAGASLPEHVDLTQANELMAGWFEQNHDGTGLVTRDKLVEAAKGLKVRSPPSRLSLTLPTLTSSLHFAPPSRRTRSGSGLARCSRPSIGWSGPTTSNGRCGCARHPLDRTESNRNNRRRRRRLRNRQR